MRSRKAVSLPINVLIVAAIGLVVLIIIIAIFSGRLGKFTKSYDEQITAAQEGCVASGGNCEGSGVCDADEYLLSAAKSSCVTALQNPAAVCCVPRT